ncbi:MAG: hypothetical protein WCG04_02210 [Alphaproteobacteria bacterium]
MNKILFALVLLLLQGSTVHASQWGFPLEDPVRQYRPSKMEVIAGLRSYLESSMDPILDLKDKFEDLGLPIPGDLSKERLDGIKKHLDKNLKDLSNFENGKLTTEEMVRRALIRRMEFLKRRIDRMEIKQSAPKDVEVIYPSTYPENFANYGRLEKVMATMSTDFYQMHNINILMLLSLIDVRTVASDIKDLIRVSVALWPHIQRLDQGISADLGHPDEAIRIGKYRIPYDRRDDHTLYDEYSLYRNCVLPETSCPPQTMVCYAGFHKFVRSYTPTFYEIQQTMLEAGQAELLLYIPPLAKLPWLKRPVLPHIVFPAIQAAIAVAASEEVEEKESEEPEQGFPFDRIDIKENNAVPDIVFPAIQAAIAVAASEEVEEKESEEPKQGFPFDRVGIKENNTVPVSSPFDELKGVHLKTYERIFDGKHFLSVSYNDFKTLWTHLGGSIPNPKSGTSHRDCLYNGKKIAMTYVPHGNHTYGKRVIKSVRQALEDLKYIQSQQSLNAVGKRLANLTK